MKVNCVKQHGDGGTDSWTLSSEITRHCCEAKRSRDTGLLIGAFLFSFFVVVFFICFFFFSIFACYEILSQSF